MNQNFHKMINGLKTTIIIFVGIILIGCNNSTSTKKTINNNDDSKEKNCISQVIAIDDKIGKIRNHDCETISLSETIRNYVSGIDKIDFSNCPAEFKQAFTNHKNAWSKMITVTDKYPDLRGEMHDLFKILEKGDDKEEFKTFLDSIWSTWAEVEKSMGKE